MQSGSAWDAVQRAAAVGRAVPIRVALSIFIQLCAALEALHAAGLAHRDVKPHNVLLEPRQGGGLRAVLVDFGSVAPCPEPIPDRDAAARLQEEAEAHSSAPYRAPELWEAEPGRDLTAAADVWSAGALLYCLVWGASPFERATCNGQGGSLRLAVLNGRVPFAPDDRAAAPDGALRRLVERCLAPDPAARPSAAAAKLEAQGVLEELAQAHLVPGA